MHPHWNKQNMLVPQLCTLCNILCFPSKVHFAIKDDDVACYLLISNHAFCLPGSNDLWDMFVIWFKRYKWCLHLFPFETFLVIAVIEFIKLQCFIYILWEQYTMLKCSPQVFCHYLSNDPVPCSKHLPEAPIKCRLFVILLTIAYSANPNGLLAFKSFNSIQTKIPLHDST